MLLQAETVQPETGDDCQPWPDEAAAAMCDLQTAMVLAGDRRKVKRLRYLDEASLELIDGQEPQRRMAIYARDINHTGLGFISPHSLLVGQRVRIRLKGRHGMGIVAEAMIRRARQYRAGWYDVFAEF